MHNPLPKPLPEDVLAVVEHVYHCPFCLGPMYGEIVGEPEEVKYFCDCPVFKDWFPAGAWEWELDVSESINILADFVEEV